MRIRKDDNDKSHIGEKVGLYVIPWFRKKALLLALCSKLLNPIYHCQDRYLMVLPVPAGASLPFMAASSQ